MALDEKKKEIVGSNFFKSLTQTNKLLFKSASITEVYSETNVYSKKDETYYNPLFKSFSFKYDLIINIILTSILNSQTVTNTLIQTDKFEYDTPKEREIPMKRFGERKLRLKMQLKVFKNGKLIRYTTKQKKSAIFKEISVLQAQNPDKWSIRAIYGKAKTADGSIHVIENAGEYETSRELL